MLMRGGEREWHSDAISRGLSHHSTVNDAGGLDFRVRYGTGYYPSALAVHNSLSNVFGDRIEMPIGQRPTKIWCGQVER